MEKKCQNFPIQSILTKKRSRNSSVKSDCQKNRAEPNSPACFARVDHHSSKLLMNTKELNRSDSTRVNRMFKPLNNLSEVSNQSTCSKRSPNSSLGDDQNPSRTMRDDSFFNIQRETEVRASRSSMSTNVNRKSRLSKKQRKARNFTKSRGSITSDASDISRHSKYKDKKIKLEKWIPDEFSKRCMKCKRQFDFFTRKHHCRRCGYLLCFSC